MNANLIVQPNFELANQWDQHCNFIWNFYLCIWLIKINQNCSEWLQFVCARLCGELASKVKRSNCMFGNKIKHTEKTRNALRRRTIIELYILSLQVASVCKWSMYSQFKSTHTAKTMSSFILSTLTIRMRLDGFHHHSGVIWYGFECEWETNNEESVCVWVRWHCKWVYALWNNNLEWVFNYISQNISDLNDV